MPRQKREHSDSKVYHVIIKGIDNGDIFYDNEDKSFFLEQLKLTKNKFKYKIYAYCLMNNHVHLVIEALDEILSKAMQGLTIRYVHFFNKKYDRRGPLIQERFKSKKIENQKYFLEVCRYVHRNPEKAGIAKTFEYNWSSYKEYIYDEKVVESKVLLHYFADDINEFIKYTNKIDSIEESMNLADFEMKPNLNDEEVINIILKKLNLNEAKQITIYFKDKKKREKLKEFKEIYKINKTQISRITRVSKRIIGKVWGE